MCAECSSYKEAAINAEQAAAQIHEQLTATQQLVTELRMRLGKVMAENAREAGQGAEAKIVLDIIQYWVQQTGHTKAKVSAAGERAKYVRKALHMGHSVEEIKEAIDGAARFPYVVNKRRSRTGSKEQLYDDLPTVLRDEVQIQKMRRLSKGHGEPLQPVAQPEAEPSPPSAIDEWRKLNYPWALVTAALWEKEIEVDASDPDVRRGRCPVHFGPGLIVNRREDGVVSLVCSAGCEFWRLLAALGLEAGDLFENCEHDPDRKGAPVHHEIPDHLREAASQLVGMGVR
jgi:hypothetical protein